MNENDKNMPTTPSPAEQGAPDVKKPQSEEPKAPEQKASMKQNMKGNMQGGMNKMNKGGRKMMNRVPMPGGRGRSPMRSAILFILVFVAFAWILSLYNNPMDKPKDVSVSQVAESVKKGEVKSIVVSEGSNLSVELTNGEKLESKKEATDSLQTLLASYGATPEQIQAADVRVETAGGFSYFLGNILPVLIPAALIIFFFWFMMRQANGANSKAMSFGQSTARMFDPNAKKRTTFADVAGAAEAKEELTEVVDFLKNPKKYTAIGAKIPKGLLLMGSPGTGKTLLARAVAGEANVPFFHMSGSEFMEMFVGVGASRVRDVFRKAKKAAPAILFIDEIDAVGRQRGAGMGGGNDEREQTLNQILTEMDGFEEDETVIVIAATNRPDVLDPALLRPGRFDRRVMIDLPDVKDREEILKVHGRNKLFTPEVDMHALAQRTTGFSGAELMNLLNEAAIFAARHNRKKVNMEDCVEAIDKVLLGPQKKNKRTSVKEKEVTAYHEAGHALIAYLLPDSDNVHKVTIIPRGHAGGYTLKLPEEDKYLRSRKEMVADIAVALGSYAAEMMMFGDVTTGPSSDLESATKTAHRMVTRYGMSEKLGTRIFGENNDMPFLGREIQHQRDYSEHTAQNIDTEVSRIIREQYELAQGLLKEHIDKLHIIAKTLLDVETLEKDQFEAILEGKPMNFYRDKAKAERASSEKTEKNHEETMKHNVTPEEQASGDAAASIATHAAPTADAGKTTDSTGTDGDEAPKGTQTTLPMDAPKENEEEKKSE